jgi:hypothetical protein
VPVLQLVCDENFNGKILRALQRRIPELDAIRFQDTPDSGAEDSALLEWSAQQSRVLVTHDIATLVGFAYTRICSGRKTPGVIAVQTSSPIGQVIEDLVILLLAGTPEELENQVVFIPL